MRERNLKNKDFSIQTIVSKLLNYFGQDYFEKHIIDNQELLIDFWESDLYAIGLKINEKSIYISSWDFRENNQLDMQYYVEFEIIDIETLDTLHKINMFKGINAENLVNEVEKFIT